MAMFVSGSSTSTGSFSQVVADKVYFGNRLWITPRSTFLRFESGTNFTGFEFGEPDNQTVPFMTIKGSGISGGGMISGSALSTGSFGSVHTVGNVGIGTSSPEYKLHVKTTGTSEDAYIMSETTGGGDAEAGFITKNANGTQYIGYMYNTSGDAVYGPAGQPKFTIQGSTGHILLADAQNISGSSSSTGSFGSVHVASKVGIGTLSPGDYGLTVSSSGNALMSLDGADANYSGIHLKQLGVKRWEIMNHPTADKLYFNSYSNDGVMVLENGGDVGIGTTDPAHNLHINGSGEVTMRISSTGGWFDMYMNASNAFSFQNAAGGEIAWWNDQVAIMKMRKSMVGIGYMSIPDAHLHVSSSGAWVGSSTASLHIEGSGSNVVAVDGTQGRLFSVTDEMSGSIFSANTIAGLPVIEAFSNNQVNLGPFSSPVQIDASGNVSGSSTSTGSFAKLDVPGTSGGAALRFGTSGTQASEFGIRRKGSNLDIAAGTSSQIRFYVDESNLAWTIDDGSDFFGGGTIQTGNGSAAAPAYQLGSGDDGFFHSSGIAVQVNDVTEFLLGDGGTFHADDDIIAYSGTVASDKRLKTNIQNISSSLDKVKKLRPVEFDWLVDRDRHEYGLISQEVEKVVPEIVTEHDAIGDTKEFLKKLDGTETFKTVDYAKLTVLLVDAMKEQQEQINELKLQIKEIKNGLSQ